MPVAYVAGYGAGIQVHVEDLGACLAGRERCNAGARMGALFPAYQALAAKLGWGSRRLGATVQGSPRASPPARSWLGSRGYAASLSGCAARQNEAHD